MKYRREHSCTAFSTTMPGHRQSHLTTHKNLTAFPGKSSHIRLCALYFRNYTDLCETGRYHAWDVVFVVYVVVDVLLWILSRSGINNSAHAKHDNGTRTLNLLWMQSKANTHKQAYKNVFVLCAVHSFIFCIRSERKKKCYYVHWWSWREWIQKCGTCEFARLSSYTHTHTHLLNNTELNSYKDERRITICIRKMFGLTCDVGLLQLPG